MKIAILGGGHGSYAAAADLSEAGHECVSGGATPRRWSRSSSSAASRSRTLTGAATCRSPAPPPTSGRCARRRADRDSLAGHRAGRHRAGDGAAPRRRPGRVPAAGHFRQLRDGAVVRRAGNTARVAWAETGTLPYLARKHGEREVNITIRAMRLPDRRLSGREAATRDRGRSPGLSERARLRGRAFRRADERRPVIHPPLMVMNAAPLQHFDRWDIHNEGTQPRGARRHRRARPRAHRGARGARLRRAAFSARRPLRQRPLDVRRRARAAGEVGRLARAHRPAHASLHRRRHRARPRLPGLRGALRAGRRAGRARLCWRSSAASSAGTCARVRARSKRSASPASTPACCGSACTTANEQTTPG